MLFHSQVFILAFLPVVATLYYVMARHVALREWHLVASSLVFYAWWDIRFLPLLVAHTSLSWLAARAYCATGRRFILDLAICANFASLAFFKYWNFLIAQFETLIGAELPKSDILLPIGISFFTFQIVSYLIDVRRDGTPQYTFRRFTLFVVFFPQLIAGPIVRHNEIITQFDHDPWRDGWAERLSKGLTVFLIGFALKVLVADRLADVADPVFKMAETTVPPLADAWLATLAFALQIYFDFMAYSEMAIGLALVFGLTFPLNFNAPYRALSLQDFWRRWHMTLSRFLRDYLYIPLGGSREGMARFVLATMITMGLCGLWHGAGWTFVIWGLLHGAGLLLCRLWRNAGVAMPDLAAWSLTFLFVAVTFMVFRSPDLASAQAMGAALSGAGGSGALPKLATAGLVACAFALALLPKPVSQLVDTRLAPSPAIAALGALTAVYLVLEVGRGQPANFIYFQF